MDRKGKTAQRWEMLRRYISNERRFRGFNYAIIHRKNACRKLVPINPNLRGIHWTMRDRVSGQVLVFFERSELDNYASEF